MLGLDIWYFEGDVLCDFILGGFFDVVYDLGCFYYFLFYCCLLYLYMLG